MLDRPEKPQFDHPNHPSSILYFAVSDIQSAHRRLVDAGVTIVEEPRIIAPMPDHDLWMSFFRDTEGNAMALMSEVPRK
jgi:methylmalonyl-CoA/ethylmalonyl-CoA epimerase